MNVFFIFMDLSKNNFVLAKSLLDLAKNTDERKCYLTFLLYTIYCVLISVSLSLLIFFCSDNISTEYNGPYQQRCYIKM